MITCTCIYSECSVRNRPTRKVQGVVYAWTSTFSNPAYLSLYMTLPLSSFKFYLLQMQKQQQMQQQKQQKQQQMVDAAVDTAAAATGLDAAAVAEAAAAAKAVAAADR
jgi:hypothetical protein